MNDIRTVLPSGRADSEHFGLLFALGAVAVATAIAAPLFLFVSLPSLLLIYVLAVVVTGLRKGSGPALLAAFIGLCVHNYLYTVPYFAFGMPHEDDFYSLLLLSLIALACGPVASRIRQHFIELHLSNRYLEALRLLGQDLSVAEDSHAVWEATARELRSALQTECWLLHSEDGQTLTEPAHEPFPAEAMELMDWSFSQGEPSGRHTSRLADHEWTTFPVRLDDKILAVCLLKFASNLEGLPEFEFKLIQAMLRQSAATIGRINLSRELECTRIQAEVEQLRSAMLSSVSHDLKSPLAAIMGAAESVSLLDRQLTPEDRGELMNMIWSESHRLDTYIQNLLDMTRLENGALKIERDWVSVDDLVGSAMGRLKRYFPAVHLEYQAVAEPPLLYVNPALLEQALFNIIENAVKYSPEDETVVIRLESDSSTCRIIVEDRGPGIPAHLLDRVFDMFYVIAEGDHRKHGTGVGLAICRGMINAHNGRVSAEQRDEGGTRFVVELPLVHPESLLDGLNEDSQ
jgi:two-component system sensor histidine kinase KdpD